MSTSASSRAPRRADHIRNRAALLSAARATFAEQGPDATIEEIAHRAGVAKGTFFRHFPTKESLVQALIADRLLALGKTAQEINSSRQPGWRTLGTMMERFIDQIADDRSLAEFLERGERVIPTEEITAASDGLGREVDLALGAAQSAGEVRPDVTRTDLLPMMFIIARATARHHAQHPQLGRRYLRLFLDGIRAGEVSELGAPPLSTEDLRRARHHAPACTETEADAGG